MAADKNKPASGWIPARPHRLESKPSLLSDVLVGAQEYATKRSGSAMGRSEWQAIVGPRIAGRTRVGKLNRGVLTVKVASSAWSNELSFLKADLVSKLQRAGHEITDLRFRVDKIADDLEEKGRRPRIAAFAKQAEEKQLPQELIERLKKVDDPNLRAAIAEAARASLQKKS